VYTVGTSKGVPLNSGGDCNDFIFACNSGCAFIHVCGGGVLMIIFCSSSLCYSFGVFIHFGDRGL
jgi:hypothetical protein